MKDEIKPKRLTLDAFFKLSTALLVGIGLGVTFQANRESSLSEIQGKVYEAVIQTINEVKQKGSTDETVAAKLEQLNENLVNFTLLIKNQNSVENCIAKVNENLGVRMSSDKSKQLISECISLGKQ